MTKKKSKAARRNRITAIIAAAAVILIVLIALGLLSYKYSRDFLPGTSIDGVDVSGLSADTAAERLLSASDGCTFTLLDERGETVVSLPYSRLRSADAVRAEVSDLNAKQHEGLGFFAWFSYQGGAEYLPQFPGMTEETLAKTIEDAYYADAPEEAPRDAVLELTDTGYTLTPESDGHQIDAAVCAADSYPVLSGAYLCADTSAQTCTGVARAEVTTSDPFIQHCTSVLDRYTEASVSVDFGNGGLVALERDQLLSALHSEFVNNTVLVSVDPDCCLSLASDLCDEYALEGVDAKFANCAETRDRLYYRVGDEGWLLDRDALGADLQQAIEAGEDAVLTPTYDYTWYWKQYYWYQDVGDTFVEISLDNQYMWYYLDGKLLVETPVVTGNVSDPDSYTYCGFFRIAYKVEDTYLTGATWYDHVDYWMPFDGNIGMHDSSWRDEYGGDIYLTNGSHGCVNTPLEAMSIIFNNIEADVPVIVYSGLNY